MNFTTLQFEAKLKSIDLSGMLKYLRNSESKNAINYLLTNLKLPNLESLALKFHEIPLEIKMILS
jgi:hypothetical protein